MTAPYAQFTGTTPNLQGGATPEQLKKLNAGLLGAAQPAPGPIGTPQLPPPPLQTGGGTPATNVPNIPPPNVGAVAVNQQAITANTPTDLRFQSVTPGQDPRLQNTQGQVDQAAAQVAAPPKYSYTAPPSGANDPFTQKAQATLGGIESVSAGSQDAGTKALQDQLLRATGGLFDTPDRGQIADDRFRLLQEQYEPGYQQSLRGVGQRAAALGRVGSGMTTSDLGDVAQRKNEFFGQQARGLASDAAAQEMSDRINRTGAVQGAFGASGNYNLGERGLGVQAGGLNAANQLAMAQMQFGMGSDLRNENRTDQLNAVGVGQTGYGNVANSLGQLSGLEGQQYGEGVGARNEIRGERDFQGGLDDKAQQAMIDQLTLEEGLLGGATNRENQGINTLGNLGYGSGDPSQELGFNSRENQTAATNAYGGAGKLLEQSLLQQQTRRPAPGDPAGIGGYQPRVTRPPSVAGPTGLQPAPTQFPGFDPNRQ